MNYLSVELLRKNYDEKQVLDDVTFGIHQGQKIALVGLNGCGKSTLLKVLAGVEIVDSGKISFKKNVTVGYLGQQTSFFEKDTIRTAIFSNHKDEFLQVISNYEYALFLNNDHRPNAPDLGPLIEKMDSLNAWDYEHMIKQILGKLDLYDLNQNINELSGGQKKRIAIAQILVTNPDFLILDEPTNHLDLEAIEWLEHHLSTLNTTMIMVTHDRYFLDRLTDEILELDNGKIYRYVGNYTKYLIQKNERKAIEQSTISKAKKILKTETEWMRKQPKARGTKAKSRIDAYHDLKEVAKKEVSTPKIEIKLGSERQGKKIFTMKRVSKKFGNKNILNAFSYTFKKNDRIGFIGANGVGKTTFLKLLSQEISPDSGIVESGMNTKIGYYSQEEPVFDPEKRVIDIVREVAEYIKIDSKTSISAAQLLDQFLFPPKSQFNRVGKLSGGEKRRLQLLRVLMGSPNFLILDEPTNDLDIATLTILKDYLDLFQGCLVIVTHDRFFMDHLVDHLFVFKGEGCLDDFPGNYSQYRDNQDGKNSVKQLHKNGEEKSISQGKKNYEQQKEIKSLERQIEQLGTKIKFIENQLSEETDYEKMKIMGEEIEQIKKKIEEKEMKWLEQNLNETIP